MGLIAAFLIPIILFFWFAACLSVIAWLKTLSHLCFGHFIRASLWFCAGTAMLIWWDGRYSMDHFIPLYAVIVGMGVTATFLRYVNRILPPRRPKPFKPRSPTGLGPKTPANDNQLISISSPVKE